MAKANVKTKANEDAAPQADKATPQAGGFPGSGVFRKVWGATQSATSAVGRAAQPVVNVIEQSAAAAAPVTKAVGRVATVAAPIAGLLATEIGICEAAAAITAIVPIAAPVAIVAVVVAYKVGENNQKKKHQNASQKK
jgi:hypothetical protein